MHVLLIILGLLLMLFGGGCTLFFIATTVEGPRSMFYGFDMLLRIWMPFGLLPLVAGWFMFRHGLKIDREKRNARTPPEATP